MNLHSRNGWKVSLAVVALTVLGACAKAKPADDVWLHALKTMKFAAISRGGVRPECHPSKQIAARPQYQLLCPKLHKIPDSVIENAALPYFKRHMSEDAARELTSFFSSEGGQAIQRKMIEEVETGVYDQFNEEDSFVMGARERSEYGKALSRFVNDREQAAAVAGAMVDYIP